MITLKTLPYATAQEVFEQVANHLIKQNAKSQITHGQEIAECFYRLDTLKCAAGCLIGEDEYNEKRMEGKNWDTLLMRGIVPENHDDLICDLQKVHDKKETNTWKEELIKVATEHNLDYSFLNN